MLHKIYNETQYDVFSCSVMSDSLRPHGVEPTRLLCPLNFPGKNTGVGCHFLLQQIFPTQGLNLHHLHCRLILYHWATKEVPRVVCFPSTFLENLGACLWSTPWEQAVWPWALPSVPTQGSLHLEVSHSPGPPHLPLPAWIGHKAVCMHHSVRCRVVHMH